MGTDHEDVAGTVAFVEEELCAVPEGQRVRGEHDEEDETHTAAVDEALLDAEVSRFQQVHRVSRPFLHSMSIRYIQVHVNTKSNSIHLTCVYYTQIYIQNMKQ